MTETTLPVHPMTIATTHPQWADAMSAALLSHLTATPSPRSTPLYPGLGGDLHGTLCGRWTLRLLIWAQTPLHPQAGALTSLHAAARYVTGSGAYHQAQTALRDSDQAHDTYGVGTAFSQLRQAMTTYRQANAQYQLDQLRGRQGAPPQVPHDTTVTPEEVRALLSGTQGAAIPLQTLLETPICLSPACEAWLRQMISAVESRSSGSGESSWNDPAQDSGAQHIGLAEHSPLWALPTTDPVWSPRTVKQAMESLSATQNMRLDYPQITAQIRQDALRCLSPHRQGALAQENPEEFAQLLRVSSGDSSNAALRRQISGFEQALRHVHLRNNTLEDTVLILRAYTGLESAQDTLIRFCRTGSERELLKSDLSAKRSDMRWKLREILAHLPEVEWLCRQHGGLISKNQRVGLGLLLLATRPPADRGGDYLTGLAHVLVNRSSWRQDEDTVGLQDLRRATAVWQELGGSRAAHTAMLLRLHNWTAANSDLSDLLEAMAACDPLRPVSDQPATAELAPAQQTDLHLGALLQGALLQGALSAGAQQTHRPASSQKTSRARNKKAAA